MQEVKITAYQCSNGKILLDRKEARWVVWRVPSDRRPWGFELMMGTVPVARAVFVKNPTEDPRAWSFSVWVPEENHSGAGIAAFTHIGKFDKLLDVKTEVERRLNLRPSNQTLGRSDVPQEPK